MIWCKEAQVKELENCLNEMSCIRAGFANEKSFGEIKAEIKTKINEIRIGSNETIRSNWQSLKTKRR